MNYMPHHNSSLTKNEFHLQCDYSKALLNKVSKLKQHGYDINISLIREAIAYAKKWHAGQYRESGEPYYSHPIYVACMVSDYCFTTEAIIVAILHDVIEDTAVTAENIADLFGTSVANKVMDLSRTKINNVKISSTEMVSSLLNENKLELLIIKVLDRLHNIRTIWAKSMEKQRKIINETRLTFVNLALYLGMDTVAQELNYICEQHYKDTTDYNATYYPPFSELPSMVTGLSF